MYNCHCHILTLKNLPRNILPCKMTTFLLNHNLKWAAKILFNINPFLKDDIFDRVALIMENGQIGDESEIFNIMKSYYPSQTKFLPIALDFDFLGAGRTYDDIWSQIESLTTLKNKYPDSIFPFIGIDPRRADHMEILRQLKDRGFAGIKLYPTMGFMPNDPICLPLYNYCEKFNIPIITHVSRSGFYSYDKINMDLFKRYSPFKKLKLSWYYLQHKKCQHFTDPRNYINVLTRYPELKLSFAHFGGSDWDEFKDITEVMPMDSVEDNWVNIILHMLNTYKNLYADISGQIQTDNVQKIINNISKHNLWDRIMFGSDFPVSFIDTTESNLVRKWTSAFTFEQLQRADNVCKQFMGSK